MSTIYPLSLSFFKPSSKASRVHFAHATFRGLTYSYKFFFFTSRTKSKFYQQFIHWASPFLNHHQKPVAFLLHTQLFAASPTVTKSFFFFFFFTLRTKSKLYQQSINRTSPFLNHHQKPVAFLLHTQLFAASPTVTKSFFFFFFFTSRTKSKLYPQLISRASPFLTIIKKQTRILLPTQHFAASSTVTKMNWCTKLSPHKLIP